MWWVWWGLRQRDAFLWLQHLSLDHALLNPPMPLPQPGLLSHHPSLAPHWGRGAGMTQVRANSGDGMKLIPCSQNGLNRNPLPPTPPCSGWSIYVGKSCVLVCECKDPRQAWHLWGHLTIPTFLFSWKQPWSGLSGMVSSSCYRCPFWLCRQDLGWLGEFQFGRRILSSQKTTIPPSIS